MPAFCLTVLCALKEMAEGYDSADDADSHDYHKSDGAQTLSESDSDLNVDILKLSTLQKTGLHSTFFDPFNRPVHVTSLMRFSRLVQLPPKADKDRQLKFSKRVVNLYLNCKTEYLKYRRVRHLTLNKQSWLRFQKYFCVKGPS